MADEDGRRKSSAAARSMPELAESFDQCVHHNASLEQVGRKVQILFRVKRGTGPRNRGRVPSGGRGLRGYASARFTFSIASSISAVLL
jgi:hypothetical protein